MKTRLAVTIAAIAAPNMTGLSNAGRFQADAEGIAAFIDEVRRKAAFYQSRAVRRAEPVAGGTESET